VELPSLGLLSTLSVADVIGIIRLEGSIKRFHSSLYVEAYKDDAIAFIQYQEFHCF
jgi:hypothetical protein